MLCYVLNYFTNLNSTRVYVMQSSGLVVYFDLVYGMKNESIKYVLCTERMETNMSYFRYASVAVFEIKSAQFVLK